MAKKQTTGADKLRDTLLPKLLSGELRIQEAEEIVERVCESYRSRNGKQV